jgi:hypothetical protein
MSRNKNGIWSDAVFIIQLPLRLAAFSVHLFALSTLILVATAPAHAVPLGSFSQRAVTAGTVVESPGNLYFWLSFGSGVMEDFPTPPEHRLIDALSTAGGHVLILNSGDAFESAVAFLTNGSSDAIGWALAHDLNINSTTVAPEDLLFFGLSSGANGIDFAGQSIGAIEVIIENVQFGVRTGGETFPYYHALDFTVHILPVPEPSTAALFALGLAGLAARQRRVAGSTAARSQAPA